MRAWVWFRVAFKARVTVTVVIRGRVLMRFSVIIRVRSEIRAGLGVRVKLRLTVRIRIRLINAEKVGTFCHSDMHELTCQPVCLVVCSYCVCVRYYLSIPKQQMHVRVWIYLCVRVCVIAFMCAHV